MRKVFAWLRDKLRRWLSVPTEADIRDLSIDAVRQLYVFWERRINERERTANAMFDGREQAVHKKIAELERIAGQVTLAVSDLVTMMELEKRGYSPVEWKKEYPAEWVNEKENENGTTE